MMTELGVERGLTALLVLVPVGMALGVLLNYLADILPITRRLSTPVCVNCKHSMSWREYFGLRVCAACGQRRQRRAWLVPLLSAGLLAWMWYYPPDHLNFWEASLVLAFFGLVTMMDIEHRIIMHKVNAAGAVIGLVVGVAHRGWLETLLGGLAGFGALLIFYFAGIAYARYMTRRKGLVVEDDEALGFGDVNLAGVIGLLLGWPAVTAGLFVGILAAGLIGGGMLLASLLAKRYNALAAIPYGPFLVLGAVFILYPPW